MIRTLTQNWTIFRVLRLILGIAILVQGIRAGDWLFAMAGGLFTGMALLNAGCCAGGSCAPPQRTNHKLNKNTTIEYEEVVKQK